MLQRTVKKKRRRRKRRQTGSGTYLNPRVSRGQPSLTAVVMAQRTPWSLKKEEQEVEESSV
jgi:hypothetical protein